jgi:hypothetical protein
VLAAALFQPLRRRVQAAVDHRFNRARYDAERTTTEFADRLRDEVDLDHLRSGTCRHRRRGRFTPRGRRVAAAGAGDDEVKAATALVGAQFRAWLCGRG